MPIELRCSQCDTLLRVPGGSEGRETRCPSCNVMLRIPGTSASQYPESQYPESQYPESQRPESQRPEPSTGHAPIPGQSADVGYTPPGGAPPSPAQDDNPFASPTSTPEDVAPGTSPFAIDRPTTLDLGDLLSQSWDTFQRQFGSILVGWLVMAVSMMFVGGVATVMTIAVGAVASGGFDNEEMAAATMVPVGLVAAAGCAIFFGWVTLGWQRYVLHLVRTATAEIGMIFGNGRGFFSLIIAWIIASLPVFFTISLCVAPWAVLPPAGAVAITLLVLAFGGGFCVILAMMWSQHVWVIADRFVGPVESLSMSQQITSGHKIYIFLLFLLQSVVGFMMGLIPFYIGSLINFLVVQPYFIVVFATTYLTLTGQPILRYKGATRPAMPPAAGPAGTPFAQPGMGSDGGDAGGGAATAPPPDFS